jgi:hypothetical protein
MRGCIIRSFPPAAPPPPRPNASTSPRARRPPPPLPLPPRWPRATLSSRPNILSILQQFPSQLTAFHEMMKMLPAMAARLLRKSLGNGSQWQATTVWNDRVARG